MSNLFGEEQAYVNNLIALNKNLRDQLELLYRLLTKKIIIDTNKDNGNSMKVVKLINDLETLRSNLGIQMKTQSEIVNALFKQSESSKNKFEELIRDHGETIQGFQNQIEEISNENIIANNKLVLIENENAKVKSQLTESNNAQRKIIESNSQLAKENAKLKEEKLKMMSELSSNEIMIDEMNNKIDELGIAMKKMEEKYKKKIQQKNMIIATIDQKLQEYEQAKGSLLNNEGIEDNCNNDEDEEDNENNDVNKKLN